MGKFVIGMVYVINRVSMKIWIIWVTFVCKKVFFEYIFVLYRISGKLKIYQILMVDWLFVWFLNEILCAHCYTQLFGLLAMTVIEISSVIYEANISEMFEITSY